MNLALTSSTSNQTVKSASKHYKTDMSRVATLVLCGGQGARLHPLTATRCKPAINFGGKYRLVDFAISNAYNSECSNIFVVTQFLSSSLHKHILNTYRGINLLSAEQRPSSSHWFQGTADAVRQNLNYLAETAAEYFLILSGDQLYSMDFRDLYSFALETNADAVIASLPVCTEDTSHLGILKINSKHEVNNFFEKPQQPEILDTLKINAATRKRLKFIEGEKKPYLGSMGIYLFKRKALIDLLASDPREDFGKHLIPSQIQKGNVFAYLYQGYWEDIGTIKSFYHANMALTQPHPSFDCYNESFPVMCMPSKLPGALISNARVSNSIICEGCFVEGDEINNSILGQRTVIKKGCSIKNSYIMGNDFYISSPLSAHLPEKPQISENCIIQNAIIDKDVYLGTGVRLLNKNKLSHYDGENVFIRDGIIIIARGASLPDGFEL